MDINLKTPCDCDTEDEYILVNAEKYEKLVRDSAAFDMIVKISNSKSSYLLNDIIATITGKNESPKEE